MIVTVVDKPRCQAGRSRTWEGTNLGGTWEGQNPGGTDGTYLEEMTLTAKGKLRVVTPTR
jgi:hypothetical protein